MYLNKVLLIGYVGKDPDIRYFDSGSAMATFSLATTERGYTLANGTVVPERTEWHNIVARRDQAVFVEKWVKKGAGLYVEGKIRTRSYDDQAGVKRYVTEVYADRVEFFSMGNRASESPAAQASGPSGPSAAPRSIVAPSGPSAFSVPSSSPSLPSGGGEEMEDDLPF